MSPYSWGAEYRRLIRLIDQDHHHQLLTDLQIYHRLLRSFRAWSAAVGFMRQGTSDDPAKNEVLAPLIRSYQNSHDTRAVDVLLTIEWPGLIRLYWRTWKWSNELANYYINDRSVLEHWSQIQIGFLTSVEKMNLDRREDGLVQRLYGDTYNRTYRLYRKEWTRPEVRLEYPNAYEPNDGDDPGERYIASWDLGHDEYVEREDAEDQIAKLRRLRDDGVISESEFFLVVGTRVYGESLRDVAHERNVDYELAKKRKQRAERKIARWDEKTSPEVSPPLHSQAPLPVEGKPWKGACQ